MSGFKVLTTADWHIGSFKGPEINGVNLRALDTKDCLDAMVERAREERPELVLVSGDIFHSGKTWSDRCCDEVITVIEIITNLSKIAGNVVVMRGTPNHDGVGPFKVLETHFKNFNNVHIIQTPQLLQTEYADIAVLPGFSPGEFRAKFPGLGREEENEVFSNELNNIVMGLKAQCSSDRPSILMAHYTVPGSNTESGQSHILTQFEPIVTVEALTAADFDLVALGHIHRPQQLMTVKNAFYSGSINANNFNDEGQDRGFWIHDFEAETIISSKFIKTPYREFITFNLIDTDITAITHGKIDEVAMKYWRCNGAATGKIVRVLYECSTISHKAFNAALLEKTLYEDGAFWVAGITPQKVEATADRNDLLTETDPEANLRKYLEEKQIEQEIIDRLIHKARPIIAEAIAGDTAIAFSGMFVPMEIEVKNYRTYAEEKFSFDDIQFCTINGVNGAGKSSLFMDAIIDCIYEEPREGKGTSVKVPWLRNDESVRSGYIAFTFSIGEKIYRITRTRTKSGKITLNLAEKISGEWEDRSCEKSNDTQSEIENLIGVDSMTFKSCALIMQDQYGLFLQAQKDKRMVVLENLLGLSIYGVMEDLAKDKVSDINKVINTKKQSIKVQTDNILLAGNPMEELANAQNRQNELEDKLSKKNLEKENAAISLATKNSAKERYKKLNDSITALKEKKINIEQNKDTQAGIIVECDQVLSCEESIVTNTKRYRELAEKEKGLIEGAALYKAKSTESITIKAEIDSVVQDIERYDQILANEKKKLDSQIKPEDITKIRIKADEYTRKKEKLEEMLNTSHELSQLKQLRDKKSYLFYIKKAHFDERKKILDNEKLILEKKTTLLAASGCLDISKANCRFLADAVQAQNALKEYPSKLRVLDDEKNQVLTELKKQLEEVEKEVNDIDFSQEEFAQLQEECNTLKTYENQLKCLQESETQIALIRASIKNIQLNIGKEEERLSTLKLKAQKIEEDKGQYQKCYVEHEQVLLEMESLKDWLEKENQLPVAKERKATAEKRLIELLKELITTDNDIKETELQAQEELICANGLEVLEDQLQQIKNEFELLTNEANNNQILIGGLNQKIEEISRMKKAINDIQKEINEMSEDAADFDVLKLAFSQDGIPHQIVRTIIPKLSGAANNILSQMTGGQLGVEFVTEKVLKSNSKKEVVTLDIFIEEYGKSSLPYLSKSGGEKVKASLSVILALAEIKASTAGIQFGMLFIDEPPFLDQDGIQAYCDALEIIRDRYGNIKIMAITHDPTMKARFPQNLDVIKTENGSKIIY